MSKLRPRHFRATSATASFGTNLETLRRLIVEAKRLSEIHAYFHDTLAADPSFMRAGNPASNERLVKILEQLLKRCASGSRLHAPLLLHVPEYEFWHGFALLGAGQMVIMYFANIDLGLCCYSRSLADPITEFVRFSAVEVPADVLPSPVRRGSA